MVRLGQKGVARVGELSKKGLKRGGTEKRGRETKILKRSGGGGCKLD